MKATAHWLEMKGHTPKVASLIQDVGCFIIGTDTIKLNVGALDVQGVALVGGIALWRVGQEDDFKMRGWLPNSFKETHCFLEQ